MKYKPIDEKRNVKLISRKTALEMMGNRSKSSRYKVLKGLEEITIEGEIYFNFDDLVKRVSLKVDKVTLTLWGPTGVGKTQLINVVADEKSQIPNKQSSDIEKGTSTAMKTVNLLTREKFAKKYPEINIRQCEKICILKRIEVNNQWIMDYFNSQINCIQNEVKENLSRQFDYEKRIIIKEYIDSRESITSILNTNNEALLEEILEIIELKKEETLFVESDESYNEFLRRIINHTKKSNNEFKEKYKFSLQYKCEYIESNDYKELDTLCSVESFEELNQKLVDGFEVLNLKIDNSILSSLDVQNIISFDVTENKKSNFVGKYITLIQRCIKKIIDGVAVYDLLKLDSSELYTFISLIEYDGLQSEVAETLGIEEITLNDTKGANDREELIVSQKGMLDAVDVHLLVLTKEEKMKNVSKVLTDTEIKASKIGFVIVNKDLTENTPEEIKEEIFFITKKMASDYRDKCIVDGLISATNKDLAENLMFTTLYYPCLSATMPRIDKYDVSKQNSDKQFAINCLRELFDDIKYRKLLTKKILLETFDVQDFKEIKYSLGEKYIKELEGDIYDFIHGNPTKKLNQYVTQYPKNIGYVRKNLINLVKYGCDGEWAESYCYHYISLIGFITLQNICNELYERLLNEESNDANKYEVMANLVFFDALTKYLFTKNCEHGYVWWSGSITTQRLSQNSFVETLTELKQYFNREAYLQRVDLNSYTENMIKQKCFEIIKSFVWIYLEKDFFEFKKEIKEEKINKENIFFELEKE